MLLAGLLGIVDSLRRGGERHRDDDGTGHRDERERTEAHHQAQPYLRRHREAWWREAARGLSGQ